MLATMPIMIRTSGGETFYVRPSSKNEQKEFENLIRAEGEPYVHGWIRVGTDEHEHFVRYEALLDARIIEEIPPFGV